MELTTKQLRSHARLLLDMVQRGETVTITYRGRPSALVIGIEEARANEAGTAADSELFGLWAGRDDLDDVNSHVRALRRGRFA